MYRRTSASVRLGMRAAKASIENKDVGNRPVRPVWPQPCKILYGSLLPAAGRSGSVLSLVEGGSE